MIALVQGFGGEGKRITHIYACILLYILLKAVAFDVLSKLTKWRQDFEY